MVQLFLQIFIRYKTYAGKETKAQGFKMRQKYEKIVNVLAPTIMVLKQSRVTNFIILELSNIHISV